MRHVGCKGMWADVGYEVSVQVGGAGVACAV